MDVVNILRANEPSASIATQLIVLSVGILLILLSVPAKSRPSEIRDNILAISASLSFVLLLLSWVMRHVFGIIDGQGAVWDAGILAVSTAWMNGQPVYPELGSGEFYGFVYGPLLFEVLGFGQKIFGLQSDLAAIPLELLAIIGVLVSYISMRRSGYGQKISRISTASLIVVIAHINYTGLRADGALMFFGALSLFLIPFFEQQKAFAGIALGAIAGGCFCLKFTGSWVCAPVGFFALLCGNSLWARGRLIRDASLGFCLTALLPYSVSGVSLVSHWQLLSNMRPFIFFPSQFVVAAMFSALLVLPALVIGWSLRPRFIRLLISLVMALVPVVFICSYETWIGHMLPFLPAAAMLLGEALNNQDKRRQTRNALLMLAFIWMASTGTGREVVRSLKIVDAQAYRVAAENELSAFLGVHRGDQVAFYGNPDNNRENAISLLVGRPLLYGSALHFIQLAWSDFSRSLNRDIINDPLLVGCRIKFWIFSPHEWFNNELFSPAFRQKFVENYHMVSQKQTFTVWGCNTEQGS